MREFYLVSWNAQGAVTSDLSKKQILNDIVKNLKNAYVIFAIQEAGVNQTLYSGLAGKAYKVYWESPEYAKNARCTLGFLVPDEIECDFSPIKIYEDGSGTPLDRAVPCCTLSELGIRIACIHAIANAEEAKKNVLEALNCLISGTYPFILAGDMNSVPEDYNNSNISRFVRLVHSGKPTQLSGNELDYFFVHNSITVEDIFTQEVDYSDHNPVIMKVII